MVTVHDKVFVPFIEEEDIRKRVIEMGQKLSDEYRDKNPILICVLNGSFIFGADLIRELDFPCELTFVKLSSYSGLSSTGHVQEVIGLELDLTNRHVLILEDIIDTGRTLNEFLNTLYKKELASVALATLLLKPDALQYPLKVDYCGFEIPDKFVIGYGLDYDQHGRNLKGIYQLKD